ncbi:MAG: polyhydroxyalkanoate synthesis regulator DNA-binding domain-containing protein [Desulfobacterales bacterium]|jgi:polyhydroxyalkanoate synthesis repressor PhaR
MAEEILIKKYLNRRLYDTEKSAYVSLNHVAELVREGRRVKVIDAKTKEDATAFVLTQIILEEARKKNTLLPVPLLHMIIQYGENILAEFFERYLQQIIENYLAYKTAFDEQFRNWLDLGIDLSSVTEKAMFGLTPSKSFFDLFSDSGTTWDKEKKED